MVREVDVSGGNLYMRKNKWNMKSLFHSDLYFCNDYRSIPNVYQVYGRIIYVYHRLYSWSAMCRSQNVLRSQLQTMSRIGKKGDVHIHIRTCSFVFLSNEALQPNSCRGVGQESTFIVFHFNKHTVNPFRIGHNFHGSSQHMVLEYFRMLISIWAWISLEDISQISPSICILYIYIIIMYIDP